MGRRSVNRCRKQLGELQDSLSRIQEAGANLVAVSADEPVDAQALAEMEPALAEGVMELIPRFALKEGVVAIGEIGYDEQTALEDKYFRAQLELAPTSQMAAGESNEQMAASHLRSFTLEGNEHLRDVTPFHKRKSTWLCCL